MKQWKEIHSLDQWQHLFDNSAEQPFIVLKHSTTCPVSANALAEYEEYLENTPNEQVDYLLVKVIESRPISNKIAADTNITHASPQVLYVKNKEVAWNTSHWSITVEHISAVLD
ncbi:MAG: general stress protein [Paenibacillus sp. RIFOXYA1_FULL_44_5]|nr:MAG: general stress protein [Paenibacillus sp. RIFOXYA1_FULL_44_5]